MTAVTVRFATLDEREALENLQLRSSIALPSYRDDVGSALYAMRAVLLARNARTVFMSLPAPTQFGPAPRMQLALKPSR